MKLLLDQNVSRKLAAKSQDIFPETTHVIALGMEASTDMQVWDFAKRNDFRIVTKDVDFSERVKLLGPPPQIVWLRCGNTTPAEVGNILRTNAVIIMELESNRALGFVEIR